MICHISIFSCGGGVCRFFFPFGYPSHKFLGFSYCGAQIFEIYGLGKEVVDIAFCGSKSSIGGLTLDEVI